MKIEINGNKYEAESGTPLKEILSEYGFTFPCGGMGKCGKCKIKCKDIPITKLDERFLSDSALAEGWRISCDKTIDGEYIIHCPPPARPEKVRELSSCNIAVRIGVRNLEIGIADDEIAEKVIVNNPLFNENGLALSATDYEENKAKYSRILRAIIGKESIELFEKYGKAKAETMAIASNGYFASILTATSLDREISDYNDCIDENNLSLPTESIYFLPIKNAYIGGDIFAETINFSDNSMLIDCDDIFKIISIEREENVACAMWDMVYDETGLKAVRAAIKTMRPEGYTPFVYLYGKNAKKLEPILIEEGLTFTNARYNLENVAKTCYGLRFRTKLNREKDRTSIRNLLSDENFHRYFSEV